MSRAVKCPSIDVHLATNKVFQASFAHKQNVLKYISEEEFNQLRISFNSHVLALIIWKVFQIFINVWQLTNPCWEIPGDKLDWMDEFSRNRPVSWPKIFRLSITGKLIQTWMTFPVIRSDSWPGNWKSGNEFSWMSFPGYANKAIS